MKDDRSRPASKRSLDETGGAPLSGIRVLDLTRLWSGPLAGRILADLGAEVIHVVGRSTLSAEPIAEETACLLGIYPENRPGDRPWDCSSADNDFHRNKRSLTLELDTREGKDIFLRLVRISDVLLENFTPRVMPNLGLDYETLKRIRPDLIYCSISGYGQNGPARDDLAYGGNIEAFSGLCSLTGYPDQGPLQSGQPIPDATAALHAAAAVLTALVFRKQSGQGQWIDLSMAESAVSLIARQLLHFGLSGIVPRRKGNQNDDSTWQGCCPCRGEDRWLVFEVSGKEARKALAPLLDDPKGRKEEPSALSCKGPEQDVAFDQAIRDWSEKRTPKEAMTLLQGVGIPAGAVWNAADLLADVHLRERGFFLEIRHPLCGPRKYARLPIRFSETVPLIERPAPCLGEDNVYVLKGLLGLSEEEVKELEKKRDHRPPSFGDFR